MLAFHKISPFFTFSYCEQEIGANPLDPTFFLKTSFHILDTITTTLFEAGVFVVPSKTSFQLLKLHLVLWRVNTISYAAFAYLWHKNFQKIFSPKKCFATTITLINLVFVLRVQYWIIKKSSDDSVFSLMEAIIKVRILQKCTSQCGNYILFLSLRSHHL